MKEIELNNIIRDLKKFCASDIMKQSMSTFMDIPDIETRWKIAMEISAEGYKIAAKDINDYFMKEYKKESENKTNT